eukprot:6194379-Amphidinium_carterae.1
MNMFRPASSRPVLPVPVHSVSCDSVGSAHWEWCASLQERTGYHFADIRCATVHQGLVGSADGDQTL